MSSSTRRRSNRQRRQGWLVGTLAVLVAVLIAVTIYRSESGPTPSAGQIIGPTPAATPAAVTSEPSPAISPTPITSARAVSLAAARKALRGPATISVIGDSTGNDSNEWVSLWAAGLGRTRAVKLEQWLDGSYRPDPLTFGKRGDPVTIWNASEPGAAAGWAASRIDAIEPERPDLVVISFGHNNSGSDIGPQLDGLLHQIDSDAAVVLILQNPGLGTHQVPQAATLASAQHWASANRVPTIDVTSAFTDPKGQMLDDVHPNKAGSRAWAKAVKDALHV